MAGNKPFHPYGGTTLIEATLERITPHLPPDMVAQLRTRHCDFADVMSFAGARDCPLRALWKVALRSDLLRALMTAKVKNGLPVMRLLATSWVRKIVMTDEAAFANINTSKGHDRV